MVSQLGLQYTCIDNNHVIKKHDFVLNCNTTLTYDNIVNNLARVGSEGIG